MSGNSRFIYDNLLAASTTTITASSNRTGFATSFLKSGTGSATIAAQGVYTGVKDLEYQIQIDSVTVGNEIGQSTLQWKTSDDATWVATGVATSGTISLSNGLSVTFTSGSGNDFELGDTWYFKGINRFSAEKIKDFDRDTRYRSAAGSAASGAITVIADYGSAQTFDTFILMDHNLSASATITFEANATDSWGAPSFSESVTWVSSKILHYLSATQTYRYTRIVITNTGNADGYIQIGEMFIGEYMELSRSFKPSHNRSIQQNITEAGNRYGVVKRRLHSRQQTFKGSYEVLGNSDHTSLTTMLESVGSLSDETLDPIFFNIDSADTSDFYLMQWITFPINVTYNSGSARHYTFQLDLLEVAKSVSD